MTEVGEIPTSVIYLSAPLSASQYRQIPIADCGVYGDIVGLTDQSNLSATVNSLSLCVGIKVHIVTQ